MSYVSEVENRLSLDGPGCGTACSCGPCKSNLSGLGERYERTVREAVGSRDSLSFYGFAESVSAPSCEPASGELEVLSDNLKWLNNELRKGAQADAKKLAAKRRLVVLAVEVIIRSLDVYIAAGCCEPQLRTLEADAKALSWPSEAQPLKTKLVSGIIDAQIRAKKDTKHC